MLNKVILLGNLGAAPEQKATQNGTIVTTFSVATTRQWTGNDDQKQKQTEWHRIVTFGRLAEICGQYLCKGSKVYIEGRLQTRQWDDQNGNKRYTTEVVANEMKMLDSRQIEAQIDRQQNEQDLMNGASSMSDPFSEDPPF